MSITEKLCLKLDDFQANVSCAFGSLREEKDFADVTLACEDGQQVEAHKVILASSSAFFHNLLKRNKHQHPLIYMRGLKYEDLIAILDFQYYGETSIHQENLDSFLAIAEELMLTGLTGTEKGETTIKPNETNYINNQKYRANKEYKQEFHDSDNKIQEHKVEDTVTLIDKKVLVSDLQELDEKIKSMMTKGDTMCSGSQSRQRVSVCTVCGKEGQMTIIKNHIEANHIEGIAHPCDFCDKTLRSANLYMTY